MNKVHVIIPSFRRSDRVHAWGLCDDMSICIPESDLADYEAKFPRESLIVHPDEVIGLQAKKNWIFDNVQQPSGDDIFMLDDDVRCVRRLWGEGTTTREVLSPSEVRDVIESGMQVVRDMDTAILAFANRVSPLHFRTITPFALKGQIYERALGWRFGHNLRCDERLTLRGEIDISCQNAYFKRTMFKDQRFCFDNHETANPDTEEGGNALYKNSERLQSEYDYLVRKWGPDVVQKARSKTGEKAGFFAVSVKLPY